MTKFDVESSRKYFLWREMPTFPQTVKNPAHLSHTRHQCSPVHTRRWNCQRLVHTTRCWGTGCLCTRQCLQHTQGQRERHAHGIFTQLINISATLLPSLCKYVLLAVKGIRRGLTHLHRPDCGNRHRSSRKGGPRYSKILFLCGNCLMRHKIL